MSETKAIVIAVHGTFRLSNAAITFIAAQKNRAPIVALGDENRLMGWGNVEDDSEPVTNAWDIPRDDVHLLEAIRILGPEAALPGTVFRIVETPVAAPYFIRQTASGETVYVHGSAWESTDK
jgi:hypothetical protein